MRTGLFNIPWLDANSNRNYPLDDRANKRDDAGLELPDDLIADINIWFPNSFGVSAFISSVTVTPNLVSLTICAHDTVAFQSAGTSGTFIPLAGISILKPVDSYKNYQLTPYQKNVGGWVTFGAGVNKPGTQAYRFSNPTQSTLLPRVARAYPDGNGVLSLSKYGYATKLNGLIKFLSQNTDLITIAKESVTIDGTLRDAITFSLNEGVSGSDVYKKFLGPCDGRPESNTCINIPIHNINSVTPDCTTGVIKIYVTEITQDGSTGLVLSYADMGSNTNIGASEGDTISVDYDIGMSNVCQPKSTAIYNDKLDHCDAPCDSWTDSATTTTPLSDICFAWYTGRVAEPGFGGPSGVFTRYSGTFSVNVSGLISTDPVFTISGASAGILTIMNSSSSIGLSTSGSMLIADIPSDAIIIKDNVGNIVYGYCDDNTTSHPPTVAKRVRNGGNPAELHDFVDGATLTNCTSSGHVSDITELTIPQKSFGYTFTLGDFPAGWVTGGVLNIKLGHLVSGYGFANVEFQCASGLSNSGGSL